MQEYLNGKYKIFLDESWDHAVNELRDINRKWFEYVPTARGGMIYLWSDNPVRFAWYTTSGIIASEIAKNNPDCRLDRLDGEVVLHFPLSVLKTVLSKSCARRKRKLPEASKEAFARGREKGLKKLLVQSKELR